MNKFKVGDKVRLLVTGDIFEVTKIYAGCVDAVANLSSLYGYGENHFELVSDFSNHEWRREYYPIDPAPVITNTSTTRKCSCDFSVIWREGCQCRGI